MRVEEMMRPGQSKKPEVGLGGNCERVLTRHWCPVLAGPTGTRLRGSLSRLRLGTRLVEGPMLALVPPYFANLNLFILMFISSLPFYTQIPQNPPLSFLIKYMPKILNI